MSLNLSPLVATPPPSSFTSRSSISPPPTSPPKPSSYPVLSFSKATPEWCEHALSIIKPRCATGLDKLPPRAIIAACSIISYPLSSIINSSIALSHFLSQWKCAAITPLHKGGDRSIPSNYCPISVLPVCSKLLEKHIHRQLSSHLNSNNLLYSLQCGFRPTHSTQTLLLHCLDKWYVALDNKQFVGIVFLDISNAFDTVHHNLLLSKLSNLGLSTSAISWFCSYLSNCCHITHVKDSYSTPGFPTSGVPQGSILSPTLISAFINDLPSSLFPDSTVLFANDTTIYIASDNLASIESSLQQSLDLAYLWLLANGLKINVSKTKSILLHFEQEVSRQKLTTTSS